MPRPLLIALIAFVATANLYAQEVKPSPAVKRILEDTARKVRVNRQAFDKANEKPLAEARQELQDLSTKLIKEGKTDEAGAVLKQVKTLDADVMRMANAPAPMAGGGGVVSGGEDPLRQLIGSWAHPNHQLIRVIDDTGTLTEVNVATNETLALGRVQVVGQGVAEVVLNTGWKLVLRPAGQNAVALVPFEPDGSSPGDGEVLFRRH